jgi:hypothetical protein
VVGTESGTFENHHSIVIGALDFVQEVSTAPTAIYSLICIDNKEPG